MKETMIKFKGRAFMHLQDAFMMEVLTNALELSEGSVLLASQTLGMSNTTFKSWCEKLGIGTDAHLTDEELKKKESLIKRALLKYPSKAQAARSLGVHRVTLNRWMKKLDIQK